MEQERQIPIWFFIGALLLVYGLLILGTGIYGWLNPPEHKVLLWRLHADVWWSVLLIAVGTAYTVKFRPTKTNNLP